MILVYCGFSYQASCDKFSEGIENAMYPFMNLLDIIHILTL